MDIRTGEGRREAAVVFADSPTFKTAVREGDASVLADYLESLGITTSLIEEAICDGLTAVGIAGTEPIDGNPHEVRASKEAEEVQARVFSAIVYGHTLGHYLGHDICE